MSEPHTSAASKCPECGKGVLTLRHVDETFEFDLGEEKIEVHAKNVPVEQCDQCGTQLSGPEAAKIRHEAVCRAAGFLTPQEIKALRDSLKLSQEEFAKLSGLGVATISRMERGRVLPNRSGDNLLYLLKESKDAHELLLKRTASRDSTGSEESTIGIFDPEIEAKRVLNPCFLPFPGLAA